MYGSSTVGAEGSPKIVKVTLMRVFKNSKTNNKEASKPKATNLGQTLEGFGEV